MVFKNFRQSTNLSSEHSNGLNTTSHKDVYELDPIKSDSEKSSESPRVNGSEAETLYDPATHTDRASYSSSAASNEIHSPRSEESVKALPRVDMFERTRSFNKAPETAPGTSDITEPPLGSGSFRPGYLGSLGSQPKPDISRKQETTTTDHDAANNRLDTLTSIQLNKDHYSPALSQSKSEGELASKAMPANPCSSVDSAQGPSGRSEASRSTELPGKRANLRTQNQPVTNLTISDRNAITERLEDDHAFSSIARLFKESEDPKELWEQQCDLNTPTSEAVQSLQSSPSSNTLKRSGNHIDTVHLHSSKRARLESSYAMAQEAALILDPELQLPKDLKNEYTLAINSWLVDELKAILNQPGSKDMSLGEAISHKKAELADAKLRYEENETKDTSSEYKSSGTPQMYMARTVNLIRVLERRVIEKEFKIEESSQKTINSLLEKNRILREPRDNIEQAEAKATTPAVRNKLCVYAPSAADVPMG